jgi:hypothetical protein
MHNTPIVAVRGEAALEVEPEIARIEVSIAAQHGPGCDDQGADRA